MYVSMCACLCACMCVCSRACLCVCVFVCVCVCACMCVCVLNFLFKIRFCCHLFQHSILQSVKGFQCITYISFSHPIASDNGPDKPAGWKTSSSVSGVISAIKYLYEHQRFSMPDAIKKELSLFATGMP